MGAAKIVAELTLPDLTSAAVEDVLPGEGNPQLAASTLASLLTATASGVRRGRLRVRVDSVTPVAASVTLVCTGANIAAAEYIEFVIGKGGPRYRVTAVASGAADGDKTFNTSGTDNTVATNIRQAINTHPDLMRWLSASGSTNNVVVTLKTAGSWGNDCIAVDGTVNGVTGEGNFAGGKDAGARATSVITCVLANTDADDTIRIGKTTFTAKASGASGEGQFNLGSTNTEMGANLLAKIVAHSDLLGLVTGTASSGVITLTWLCDPRVAMHAGYMVTSDADGLVTTTQPTTTLTLSNETSTRTYNLGCGDS